MSDTETDGYNLSVLRLTLSAENALKTFHNNLIIPVCIAVVVWLEKQNNFGSRHKR